MSFNNPFNTVNVNQVIPVQIRYAEDTNGTGFGPSPTAGTKYIGFRVSPMPSENYKDYDWQEYCNYDGREVQIRATTEYIQWKYDTDTEWKNIVEISSLKGEKGDAGRSIVGARITEVTE